MSPNNLRIRLIGFLAFGWTLMSIHSAAAADRVDPFEQVKRMGRGVNIIGYDPIWDDFGEARFKEKHFTLIREAGFHTVRVNLHAFSHMDTVAGCRLSDSFLSTLDWAVKKATEAGLMVILDEHNFIEIAKDPAGGVPKLLAFWKQIAPRYKDAPSSVIYEILNEPNGGLTPELWNKTLVSALNIIRETNPERTVIIGPAFWNTIDHLEELALPEPDRNLVVTVHYYLPMEFTHQGAPWSASTAGLSGVTWGTAEERAKVESDFGRGQRWSINHNRPILLGEFGAYDKGPMQSRVRYTSHVARTAESLGWAWTYWQFDSDFIVYDIDKDRWVEPILKALIP
jgi:endoglucanase